VATSSQPSHPQPLKDNPGVKFPVMKKGSLANIQKPFARLKLALSSP
jgi:hypothetical protein